MAQPSKESIDAACEFFGGLDARHQSGQRTVDAGEVIEHARVLVTYIGCLERIANESNPSTGKQVARKQYAVYRRRMTKFHGNYVLLTDGATIEQNECFKPPMNFRPRLFGRLIDAKAAAKVRGIGFTARGYDGPAPTEQLHAATSLAGAP